MNAKTSLKCKSGEIITGHINPEIVFRRALVLANSRDDVTIDNILSHHVGPIPVSMFHEDGTMRSSVILLLPLIILLSQKSHVEFFLSHMLSLGVTLPLPSLEMAKG
jgi:hypothetical protein